MLEDYEDGSSALNQIGVVQRSHWWMIEYNEQRPHDSLNDLTPVEYMEKNAENSTYR